MHIYKIKCVEFNSLIYFVRKYCYYLQQSKANQLRVLVLKKNKKCFSCWYEVMYGQNSLYLYSVTEYNILQYTYIFTKFTTLLYIQIYNIILHLHLVFAVVTVTGCSKDTKTSQIFCKNVFTKKSLFSGGCSCLLGDWDVLLRWIL
jgi:hypothetical protein